MKIVFISSVLNNHILPLCNELKANNDFTFIATRNYSVVNNVTHSKMPLNEKFMLNYYDDEEKEKCQEKVLEADIAIFGGSSAELLNLRKKTNKISFIYTERFFKRGSWRRFIPSTAKILKKQFIDNNENLYVLCAGSFVSKDLKLIGFDTNKCFKFGYFPLVESINLEETIIRKNHPIPKFLYVGRMLNWKRIIDILKCCCKFQKNNIPIEMNIVGDGPENKKLKKIWKNHNLKNIKFLGIKTPKEVFDLMRESNALIISSNYFEGWGAVVNEALANACPVIASAACGSTAYLIKDGVNGYSYKASDVNALYSKLLNLIKNKNKNKLYKNSFYTIKNEWNAEVAANRFLKICQDLLDENTLSDFESGPMSKA